MRRFMLATGISVALLISCLAVSSFAGDTTDKTIWGNPVKGISISASPAKSQYKLGEKIEVNINIRNTGKTLLSLVNVGDDFTKYSVTMFDAQGKPVAYSKAHEEFTPWVTQNGVAPTLPGLVASGSDKNTDDKKPTDKPKPSGQPLLVRLAPGATSVQPEVLSLDKWFDIQQPGTYTVVIMRRIIAWDAGFPISNAIQISIVK